MNCLPKECMYRHAGAAAVILGDGPSIRDYDLSHKFFHDKVSIACGRIGTVFAATYYLAIDRWLWDAHKNNIPSASQLVYGSQFLQQPPPPGAIPLHYELADRGPGPPTYGRLYQGGQTGFAALHLAYQFGCVEFFTLGIDGNEPAGRRRWWSDKVWSREKLRPGLDEQAAESARLFQETIESQGKKLWTLGKHCQYGWPFYSLPEE